MRHIDIDFDSIELWDMRPIERRSEDDTLVKLLYATQYARRRYYESGGNATFIVKRSPEHDRVIVFRLE